MAKEQPKYTIIRTDLWASVEALELTLKGYADNGLNVQEEVLKLVDLGYIKIN